MSLRPLGPLWTSLLLLPVILLLFAVSMMAGRVWIPLDRMLAGAADPRWIIVSQLRLPRTLLALAVGGALGLSGAAMQGYARNPLAAPDVLGVSSMAALGAVLTLYFGPAAGAAWLLPVCGVAGAAVGIVALLVLAGTTGATTTFLLAGSALNLLAGAGVALALSLAPNPWAASEIMTWLMGAVADRSLADVRTALPFVAVGAVLILLTGRALDALTLGETGARAVGVSLRRVQLLLVLGVGLACGASVAVTGVIGFVGLITPHLLRPLVGQRPSALLVPSALAGAALLLAADILVRLLPAAQEVRLGVAMAALGGPFFLGLLVALRRRLA